MADYVSELLNSTPAQASAPADPVGELLNSAPQQAIAPSNPVADLLGSAPVSVARPQINPDQLTAAVVAAQKGPGNGRNFAADLTSLSDADLNSIYGPGFSDNRDVLYEEAHRQEAVKNEALNTATDPRNIGLHLASGGVQLVGGLIGGSAALGNIAGHKINDAVGIENNNTTAFADKIAPAIMGATDTAANWINSFSTDNSKENARLTSFENEYDKAVNKTERDANIAAGGNPTIESMKNLGKDFLDVGSNVVNNPSSLSDTVAEGIGSSLGAGKFISGIEKMIAGSGAYRAAKLASAIDDGAMAKILGYAADTSKVAVTAGSVGLTEAAGTYQQSLQEVLDMPEDQLLKSPEYFHLVENGMSPADARSQVANRVAKESFFTQLPLATASSLMALKFDANPLGLFKEGLENGLAGIGRTTLEVGGQTVEEMLQSGSGQYAQNLAVKNNIDPGQELLANVGEQGALGAIGGFGMAGAFAAPGVAVSVSNGLNKETPAEPAKGVNRKDTFDPWGTDSANTLTPEKIAMDKNQKEFDSKVVFGASQRLASLEEMANPPAGGSANVPTVAMTPSQKAELRFLRENIDKPENLKSAYGIVDTTNQRLPEDPGGPVKSDSTIAAEKAAADQAAIDAALAKQQTRDEWVTWIKSTRDSALKAGTDAVKAAGPLAQNVSDTIKAKTPGVIQAGKDAVAAATPYVKAGLDAAAPYTKAASEAAAPYVTKAKDAARKGYSTARTVAGPYIEAGMNKASDVANKVSTRISAEIKDAAASSETLTRDWIGNTSEENLPQGIKDLTQAAEADTPKDLSGIVQPNTDVLSTVNNIVRGLSDSKIKARELSDSAVLYVQAHVEKLRAALPTLPADVKTQVQKVLASPQLAHVMAKLQSIDMSKTVGAAVADVKRMARLNPGNVNPAEIDKILKQENKDLTEEDVANLTAARDIALALNNHKNRQVSVNQEDSVTLTAKKTGSDAGMSATEKTSRSIQIDGFVNQEGQKLRSLGQYASDIMKGGQSPDGTFINTDGNKTSVKKVAKQLAMLTQHMINKVDALNRSHAEDGKAMQFESLSKGEKMVPAGMAGGAKAVFFHPGSQESMDQARAVENDMKAAVDIHNTLAERFPNLFPEGTKTAVELVGTMKDITPIENKTETKPGPRQTGGMSDAALKIEEATTVAQPEAKPQVEALVEAVKPETKEPIPATKPEDVSPAGETAEDKKATNPRDNLPAVFHSTFTEKAEDPQFKNAGDLLKLVSAEVEGSDEFVSFVQEHIKAIYDRVNKRISLVPYSNAKTGDRTPVVKKLQSSEDITNIWRFRALMFVNKETGKYDPRILSLAVAQVLDYLSGATPPAPSLLNDRLEEDDILISDMSKQMLEDYMNSLSIRQAVESMARKLPALLNLDVNLDAEMGAIRGATEGLIKEVLLAVADATDLIEIKDMPTHGEHMSPAIIMTQSLRNAQKVMGLYGKQAITLLLNPEDRTGPSLGTPPESVSQKQGRGNGGVALSSFEKNVEKNMQSIAHTLAPVENLVSALGKDVIFDLLGGQAVGDLHENHPYRKSLQGKNLSILRDYDDAMDIVNAIQGASEDGQTPVFYPVGITRVGRHQMKGANPQNNKILRVLVTPTHSTLDMENNEDHKNWFWLTVAQAADMTKAEKRDHADIYANTESKFRKNFGDAVAIALDYMRTGLLDKKAFVAAMDGNRKGGAVTMAQINAVFAVASLDFAKTKNDPDALQKFQTSLSFELDGLTDGPGNMMVHFGQGILTRQDYENLKRIGYYIGEKGKTTNDFYTTKGAKDFYEITSDTGEVLMVSIGKKFKAQADAVTRFAARFGDLTVEDGPDGSKVYKMTRNTAKGPVTKTVYGSSANGIAVGLAKDMLNEFYSQMIGKVGSDDPAVVLSYPEFHQDFEMLFGDKFKVGQDWRLAWMDKKSQERFSGIIKNTLAKVMSEAAKNSIGNRITKVNDSLVFVTNVQAQFLKQVFQARLAKLIKETGVKNVQGLSMRAYLGLVKEVSALAPSYFNGIQTLDIGSFEGNVSENIEFSATLDGDLRMKSTLLEPGDAGVKVIPYVTQGRGDAMMMNFIYGRGAFPEKSIFVFDGVELPIDKIGEYNQMINDAVAENWKQDVLTDIVKDFVRFMDSIPEAELPELYAAFALVQSNQSKNSLAKFQSVEAMLPALQDFADQNLARKQATEELPRSVNHMAGANKSVDAGPDGVLGFDEVNEKIQEKLLNPNPISAEEEAKAAAQFQTLSVSDGKSVLDALSKTKMAKRLAEVVKALQNSVSDVRVVMGSPAQILAHRMNEGVTKASKVPSGQGFYDPSNKTIYLMSTAHETLIHELIHFATFSLVQSVYEGNATEGQKNAVQRLEGLMEEFMALDLSKASKPAQRAAKTVKGEILRAQANKDAYSKAKALNEFMAWSLANDALAAELSGTVTNTVTNMIKKVRALMARLLGYIGHDMFSNVLFNTKAILEQDEKTPVPTMEVTLDGKTEEIPVEPEEDAFDVIEAWDGNGDDNNGQGTGGNGSGPSSNGSAPTNFWIKLIAKMIDEKAPQGFRKIRTPDLQKYTKNADKVFDGLNFGGFIFNHEQKLTFKAIHMIFAFEMNLNAASLAAMNKVFTFVVENLKPEMFAVDGQVKYQALMDAFGKTKNNEGVSDTIATFFALSQTSKDFQDALDQLPKPEKADGIKMTSFNEFVGTTATVLMRQAVGSVQVDGVAAKDALNSLSMSIINQDASREYSVLRGLMATFDAADRFASGGLRKIAEFGEKTNRLVPDEQKLLKVVSQSVQLATGLLDERRAAESFNALKQLTHMGSDLSWAIPFQEFINEMIGTDAANANLIAMLDVVKKHVSALRQNYRDKVPVILQNEFDNKPSAEQWKSTHSVLAQADFASVFDLSKPDLSFKAISDDSYRGRQIQNLEQTIKRQVSPGMAGDILEKAQQLADYMNGRGAGHQLLANAFAINYFVGDRGKGHLVEVIDKLVTFYALDGKDQKQLDDVAAMYEADPEAMKTLVVYLQALNQEEDRKLQHPPEVPKHLQDENGNPLYGDPVMKMKLNGFKGYVPNFGLPDVQLTIEDDVHEDLLNKRGFIRIADYKGEDGMNIVSRGIYKTTTRQNGGYAQGIMQSIQHTYRGVNAVTGLAANGTTSGVIKGLENIDNYTEILNDTGMVNDPKEVVSPVWDESGVAFYQRVINPDLIQEHMAPPQNLALMLGVWAGRQVEESAAEVYNNLLVDELRRVYDSRSKLENSLYIDLRAEAQKMVEYNRLTRAQQKLVKRPDPIYADSWNVIPPQTKYYIQEVFPDGFFVRKDQINVALGYAEPSIVDVWTGKTRLGEDTQNVIKAISNLTVGKLKDGTSAMTILKKGEEAVQTTVSMAKDLIVVRSIVVPYLNSQANVYNLVLRGVANKSIIKGYQSKLIEIEQYNKNFSKEFQLRMQIQLSQHDQNRVRILEDQIKVLHDQNRRMSIWPLLEAGAYKNISEGITEDDFEILRGGLMNLVDDQVKKLPQVAQTIVKNGVLAHDTKIYQLANKAVQYGDFIAKGVYFDHLIDKGMSPKAALAKINEEFVNFSVPPGRMRTALDKLGATWFLTYKVRSIKPALSQIRENPLRALMVNVLDTGTNTAQSSNLISAIDSGSIGYSIGWDMLFNSSGLNPWANMMGW